MKKIVVINGNPKANPKTKSFCQSIAEAYTESAISSGYDVTLLHIHELDFDPMLHNGYEQIQALEPDLLTLQATLSSADHLVVVYPLWWGSAPAKLKGLFDRAFLPGYAFKFEEGSLIAKRLLKGKSARIIMTMDTPVWYYKWVYRSAASKVMKNMILQFCGFKPVRFSYFGFVSNSKHSNRKKFIEQIKQLGVRGI